MREAYGCRSWQREDENGTFFFRSVYRRYGGYLRRRAVICAERLHHERRLEHRVGDRHRDQHGDRLADPGRHSTPRRGSHPGRRQGLCREHRLEYRVGDRHRDQQRGRHDPGRQRPYRRRSHPGQQQGLCHEPGDKHGIGDRHCDQYGGQHDPGRQLRWRSGHAGRQQGLCHERCLGRIGNRHRDQHGGRHDPSRQPSLGRGGHPGRQQGLCRELQRQHRVSNRNCDEYGGQYSPGRPYPHCVRYFHSAAEREFREGRLQRRGMAKIRLIARSLPEPRSMRQLFRKTTVTRTDTLTIATQPKVMERTLDILTQLVRFDTTSCKSNLDLVDWVEAYLRGYGFATERLLDATRTKANLLASIGPASELGYVLSGHTDVVPADGQIWASDPFKLRVEGGRAYGRGACDMKGFLAVCLAHAPAMAAAQLKRPLHLALTYDEEVGCIGARELCRLMGSRNWRATGCFVGEPTLMSVVIGHKSKRNIRVRVNGLTCHSSLAPNGVNAITWGARLISEITRMSEALAASGARDYLYDIPHSTGHVGLFKGGTALNVVPSHAEFLFEFRTLAEDDPDLLVSAIEQFAHDVLEPRMRCVNPLAGFEFETYADTPGLDTPEDADLVGLAKALAGHQHHQKVSFMTEGGLFQYIASIPTVVIGPGSINQAHKADEWVAIAELEQCSAFVQRLIA